MFTEPINGNSTKPMEKANGNIEQEKSNSAKEASLKKMATAVSIFHFRQVINGIVVV